MKHKRRIQNTRFVACMIAHLTVDHLNNRHIGMSIILSIIGRCPFFGGKMYCNCVRTVRLGYWKVQSRALPEL